MKHEENLEQISSYIDGELNPVEEAKLTDHLKQCQECSELYDELKGVSSLVQSLPLPTPPSELRRDIIHALESQQKSSRFSLYRWSLYASAACLAGLSFYAALTHMGKPAESQSQIAEEVSMVKSIEKKEVVNKEAPMQPSLSIVAEASIEVEEEPVLLRDSIVAEYSIEAEEEPVLLRDSIVAEASIEAEEEPALLRDPIVAEASDIADYAPMLASEASVAEDSDKADYPPMLASDASVAEDSDKLKEMPMLVSEAIVAEASVKTEEPPMLLNETIIAEATSEEDSRASSLLSRLRLSKQRTPSSNMTFTIKSPVAVAGVRGTAMPFDADKGQAPPKPSVQSVDRLLCSYSAHEVKSFLLEGYGEDPSKKAPRANQLVTRKSKRIINKLQSKSRVPSSRLHIIIEDNTLTITVPFSEIATLRTHLKQLGTYNQISQVQEVQAQEAPIKGSVHNLKLNKKLQDAQKNKKLYQLKVQILPIPDANK
ncbi:MAG: zf-HC2 domain-containing protein [Planctomycetes bacterium]|nr:zf-HC2 domain-containing protein [Planctomycetota bacterium]